MQKRQVIMGIAAHGDLLQQKKFATDSTGIS